MADREPRAEDWKCLSCHAVLGTVDRKAGTLYVTLPGAFVGIGYHTTVHCPHPCYAVKTFRGRRVIVITAETRKTA